MRRARTKTHGSGRILPKVLESPRASRLGHVTGDGAKSKAVFRQLGLQPQQRTLELRKHCPRRKTGLSRSGERARGLDMCTHRAFSRSYLHLG